MKRLDRREFLASPFGVVAASIGAAGLNACRKNQATVSDLPELRLLCWSRFFDPTLLRYFEELNRCRVKVTYFETNEELFTQIDANSSDFDVVTPSSYMTPKLVAEGRLLELDPTALHLSFTGAIVAGKEIDVPFGNYAVPHSWSAAGVASYGDLGGMNSKKWRVFENPIIHGRFTLLKDMRELLGAGLKACGKGANSTAKEDLEAAQGVVSSWLANARGLSNEAYTMALIAGEDLAAHAYNGDVWIAKRADSALRFTLPDEGTTLAMDQIGVSTGCQNVPLAHSFIRFISEPEQARRNMAWSGYLSVNPNVIARFPEQEQAIMKEFSSALERSDVLIDLGLDTERWETHWQRLFAF